MTALDEVWSKFRELANPTEPIEVSLAEAVGLVLAEPVIADVDLPPFDRAAADGYAVRAEDAHPGALLRVISPPLDDDPEFEIDAGESALVEAGGPLPLGADSVLTIEQIRSEAGSGGPRVIEVLERAIVGRGVSERGTLLEAGDLLLDAGTRLEPAMVGLLAAQGCVHPICRRRVRVALLAVGDHLVGPSEAPILHRERNAANLAVTALLLRTGAMIHDLGAVAERDAGPALDRATTAPLVIVLGAFTGGLLRRLAHDGVEPVITGVDLAPASEFQYGLIRDEEGRPAAHLLHCSLDPVEAVVQTALFALPLIDCLQGRGSDHGPARVEALWLGDPAAERRACLARLRVDRSTRLVAEPLEPRGRGDLATLARANAVALPPEIHPDTGELVASIIPLGEIADPCREHVSLR